MQDQKPAEAASAATMINKSSYTIGWICALQKEYIAARQFLDEEHDKSKYVKEFKDGNNYSFGKMGRHNVVIAVMPMGEYGTTSAATVAINMVRSFPSLRLGLMVGIGGGAPTKAHDIRLGDIVVSAPSGGKGGVYQYDYGKTVQGKKFQTTGQLNRPPTTLLTAVTDLGARIKEQGHDIEHTISTVLSSNPRLENDFSRPDRNSDRLFRTEVVHIEGSDYCNTCAEKHDVLQARKERGKHEDNPAIHYGLIASANQLMKNAFVRDSIATETGVLCFEMEAAGLMNDFPCLVVRGICDYADSHKNKEWQGYAAMTAAAYARRLLGDIAPEEVGGEAPMGELLQGIGETVDLSYAISQSIDKAVKKEAIKEWLSAPDPSINYNRAKAQRSPGTCQWCLESSRYNEWQANANTCLWLYGEAGSGKTVLSSAIIDDLRESGNVVLYYYFDFRDANKQDFEKLLRSLTWQLYQHHEDIGEHIRQLYTECKDGGVQPSCDSLKDTLQALLDDAVDTKIVIDSLDECKAKKELLDWIRACATRQSYCMLFTSRKLDDIEFALSDCVPAIAYLPVQPKFVDEDIRTFIRNEINTDRDLQAQWHSQPWVFEEIETKLMEIADGMFRWAACQVDAIRVCVDLPSLEKVLLSLPKTLDETYHRILVQIPDENRRQAIRLLQFLVFAHRPLRLKEAIDIIAVTAEHTPAFKEENRIPEPRRIARLCSSLTKVTSRVVKTPSQGRIPIVRRETITELQLAHSSVKEYLVSDRIGKSFMPDFAQCRASAAIVEVSISYIFSSAREVYTNSIYYTRPFTQLAALHWMDHAVSAEDDESARAWILKLFTMRRAFRYWYDIYRDQVLLTRRLVPRNGPDPLLFASRFGLTRTVKSLITNGAKISHQERYGDDTALRAAATNNNLEVVEILLEKYHKIDSESRKRQINDALQEAAFSGHKPIVDLIIQNNAKQGEKAVELNLNHAFCWAAEGEHTELLQFLLDKGADIDAHSDDYCTSLQIASQEGSEDIVAFLLRKGADPNAPRGEHGTALYAAATICGSEKIVRMLLAHMADPDMDGDYTTALRAVRQFGRQRIVDILVENAASVKKPRSDKMASIGVRRTAQPSRIPRPKKAYRQDL